MYRFGEDIFVYLLCNQLRVRRFHQGVCFDCGEELAKGWDDITPADTEVMEFIY